MSTIAGGLPVPSARPILLPRNSFRGRFASAIGTTDVASPEFIPGKAENRLYIYTNENAMSNTYHKMYIQTVFAVKYRNAIIQPAWKPQLMAVIGNLINEADCNTLIVNGVEDHVHCFFALKPSVCVSDVMQIAKAKSSKWVNESGLLKDRFEWQTGFGCFSYSHSHIENVYRYIQNQELHHKSETFRDEYIKMLVSFDIAYVEKYLFADLI